MTHTKKTIHQGFVITFLLIVFSCEKEVLPILPELPQQVRYLSMTHNSSSNTMIANGVNQIYFKVIAYDTDHKKMTTLSTVALNTLKIQVNGSNEFGYPFVFTTTKTGEYTFTIKGLSSHDDLSGPVTIIAIDDPDYEAVTLPVIFHYVSSGVSDNVRIQLRSQLSSNIEEVNKAFRNLLGSKDPNASNPNIQFKMADEDPEGNTLELTGFHDIYSEEKSFGTYTNSTIDQVVWNGNFWSPKKYINIWIAKLDDNYSWAYFPELNSSAGSFPTSTYGVVYNQNHIYDPMILTHELGHMLNLRHVFDDSCDDPDLCDDTWAYKRKTTDSDTQWHLTRKTCNEITFVANNYMDYYPTQNTTFTLEQVKRMKRTLDYCAFLPTEKNMLNGKMKIVPFSNLEMKREKDIPHRVI
jgi:Pregnancy-associated plasma protein-A